MSKVPLSRRRAYRRRPLAPALLLAFGISSASAGALAGRGDGSLQIFVSIPPQKYFVERIGGERVKVTVLLPPGQSPATFEPTPKQMVALASAQVYFRIGLPFEKSVVNKIGSVIRDLNIVDMRAGLDLMPTDGPGGCDHEHVADHTSPGQVDEGATGRGQDHLDDTRHDHGDLDPHTWMNPRLVQVQARTVYQELCRLDAANQAFYQKNLAAFVADLTQVDQTIAARLAPLRGQEFYVFHPAYGYFAEAYGLKQVAVESGGRQPTARQLQELIQRAKQSGVTLIFAQPQFDQRTAQTIARAIGGAVIPMDPLAEDYLNNLLGMAAKVEAALTGNPETRSD